MQIINFAVHDLKSIIETLMIAKYGTKIKGCEAAAFIKLISVNLMMNMIIEFTDHSKKDSLDKNVKEFSDYMNTWVKNYKKDKKEAH